MTQTRRPPGRYDEPRALPRPVLVVVAGLLLAALTAGAYWAFAHARSDQIDFGTTAYKVLSDTSVTVSFEVHKAADRSATCRVEAVDRDGSVVGSVDVGVGRGARVTMSRQLTTTARATTALVSGCRLVGP